MAKRKEYPPIRTESYVRINGEWTNTQQLDPAQKRWLSDWIRLTMLRQKYPGYRIWSPENPDI